MEPASALIGVITFAATLWMAPRLSSRYDACPGEPTGGRVRAQVQQPEPAGT